MQELVKRSILSQIQQRLATNPAVALLGPRQCGKTTLARAMGGVYFDLEVETDQIKLDAQWGTLVNAQETIVLDEAQAMPSIFPRLRAEIDRDRQRKGRFLLLGSVAPAMMHQVSESLAGRLALVELSPFLWDEVKDRLLDDLWFYGGYPDGGILDKQQYLQWQQDYLSLLTQRDLPQWGLPAKPMTTFKLFRMIAALHGQNWNASRIGQAMGLNHQTVTSYLEYTTGCYLIRILEPYAANLRKRLVKSPKIYWRDSGLLHALMQIRTIDDLFTQPWVGASWEGFVIEQMINHLHAQGQVFTPYYLRTSDQYEIDLLLDFGSHCCAIEVKLTSCPSQDMVKRFNKAADLIDAQQRILVCRIPEHLAGDHVTITHLPGALDMLLSVA
jgi:predicted AAA+ superfamily ATPase